MSFLSYDGSGARKFRGLTRKPPCFFLIPDEFETEEESCGLFLLDLWRQAFDSLAKEGNNSGGS
jgi:hypothetical protein